MSVLIAIHVTQLEIILKINCELERLYSGWVNQHRSSSQSVQVFKLTTDVNAEVSERVYMPITRK